MSPHAEASVLLLQPDSNPLISWIKPNTLQNKPHYSDREVLMSTLKVQLVPLKTHFIMGQSEVGGISPVRLAPIWPLPRCLAPPPSQVCRSFT